MPSRHTQRQIETLRAAATKGNAYATKGSRMGGAKTRMIDRMIEAGLLTNTYPIKATQAGMALLAKIDAEG